MLYLLIWNKDGRISTNRNDWKFENLPIKDWIIGTDELYLIKEIFIGQAFLSFRKSKTSRNTHFITSTAEFLSYTVFYTEIDM